jgi:hypothetical protein
MVQHTQLLLALEVQVLVLMARRVQAELLLFLGLFHQQGEVVGALITELPLKQVVLGEVLVVM